MFHLFELLPADKPVPIQVKLPERYLHPVHAKLQLCAELFLLHPTTAEETGLHYEKIIFKSSPPFDAISTTKIRSSI